MCLLKGNLALLSRRGLVASLVVVCTFLGVYSPIAKAQEANPEAAEPAAAPTQMQPAATAVATEATAEPEAAVTKTAPAPSSTRRGVPPYTRPLRFDPADNGLSIENPQTKWTFVSPTLINLNGLRLSSQSTVLNLTKTQRRGGGNATTTLSFKWPTILSAVGTVSIEKKDGEVVWKQKITPAEIEDWKEQVRKNPSLKVGHEKTNFGIPDLNRRDFGFIDTGQVLRFCLDQDGTVEGAHLRVCSRFYTVELTSERTSLIAEEPNIKLSLGINGREFGESGIINSQFGQPVHIRISFADGSFIDVVTTPADMKLLDVVATANGNGILFTGHGEKPLGKVKILSSPVTHFWAPTGIAQERIWQVEIPRDVPVVRILGQFNLPFNMLFTYERLPREEDRVYIEQTRSSGTYSSQPLIRGYSAQNLNVASQQSSATKTERNHFEWTFAAPNKGKENRSTLLVVAKNEANSWVAHHRLYRSYPYEMSGRLTGIASADGSLILLGEVSAAAYFESLGFTQNAYLSKQHWGLAGRYFKSLTSIQSESGLQVADLSAMNLDLKYNILPGLWQYDELVGVIASVQKINIAGLSQMTVGLGAYWARTMPKIFDDLFNYLPTMKHKKYVDMELVYYPMSLTDGYTAGSTFNLNFHGRVFWSERFYGEAGFGIRRYEFSIPTRRVNVALSALYGTAGIGFVF